MNNNEIIIDTPTEPTPPEQYTVYVKTLPTGQITSWSSEQGYGDATVVQSEDFETFNQTSGHKFILTDGQAVYQEDLPPVIFEQPKTEVELLREAIEFMLISQLDGGVV